MNAALDYFQKIVRPALIAYRDAECDLNMARENDDQAEVKSAREKVIRTARTATIELHQFSDVLLIEGSGTLPRFARIDDVRSALQHQCVYLRSADRIGDVNLLRDVAEAFKHHKLNRQNATVSSANAVITIGTGYGELRYGEGKFGGAEQVIVSRKDGDRRALSSVLQNVFDAWMRLLDQPLLPIGMF